MERLFSILTHAFKGTPAIAVSAAFAWGILSVILSPCHLAIIPLVVGYISKQGKIPTYRAFFISLMFALGLLVTIGVIGVITGAAGRMFGDIGAVGNYIVAGIFFLVGLNLLDIIPMPWAGRCPSGVQRRGYTSAFVLGLLFGLALGPCSFAYMAPMLTVTFRVSSADLSYGVLLLAAYGVGHCAVIVFAGTFTGVLQRYLNWNEKSKGTLIIKRVCGALILLGGVYLIYNAG